MQMKYRILLIGNTVEMAGGDINVLDIIRLDFIYAKLKVL